MLWCVGGVLACCGVLVACLVVFLVVEAPDSDERIRYAHRNKSTCGTGHALAGQTTRRMAIASSSLHVDGVVQRARLATMIPAELGATLWESEAPGFAKLAVYPVQRA